MMDIQKITPQFFEVFEGCHVKEWELCFEHCQGETVEAKDGAIEAHEQENSVGFGLRVFLDHCQGFTYGRSFSRAAIEQAVLHAIEGARVNSSDPHVRLPPPGKTEDYPELHDFDDRAALVSTREKQERVIALEVAAQKVSPLIKRVRGAVYRGSSSQVWLISSQGTNLYHRSSQYSYSLMAVAESQGESEVAYEEDHSPFFATLDVEKIGASAAQRALALLGGQVIKTGRVPVILDRMVASELLGVIAPSFLAAAVDKRQSFVVGKLGQRIYSPRVTLIDDGALTGGPVSHPFDGEGLPMRATTVVHKGRVENLLYDSYYGHKHGCPSTGNAVRGDILAPPQMGTTNFYLEPGTLSPAELMREMGRGLIVTEAIGLHTADPISGDFSVGVQGAWVEAGRILHAVRSVAMAGNIHEMMANVLLAADNLKFYGTLGAPTLLIKSVDISGE